MVGRMTLKSLVSSANIKHGIKQLMIINKIWYDVYNKKKR